MDDMYNKESGNSGYENNSSYENGGGYDGGGYQQQYQQPTVQEQLQYQYQRPDDELEEPMTLGEWMITLLIMLIPCANIVMAFVWAFSSKEKKSKSNFFKAYLIFMAIIIVLYIILMVVFGTALVSMFSY